MTAINQKEIAYVTETLGRILRVECCVQQPQLDLIKQCFTGKKRRFDAFEAALSAHYYHSLGVIFDELKMQEIQMHIAKAIDSQDSSFLSDFAFFIKNPLRKHSRLKAWLVEICFFETQWGDGPSKVWGSPNSKAVPGDQKNYLSGEEIAEFYLSEQGEVVELSQIFRVCRELKIKLRDPRKLRVNRK